MGGTVVVRRTRTDYSAEKDATIIREWAIGAKVTEIAVLIGHPAGSVAKRIQVLRDEGYPLAGRHARTNYADRAALLRAPEIGGVPVHFTDDRRAKADHGTGSAAGR
jgi:hypothetical protein